MTHARIDDDFYDHPKFTAVSLAAWGLWTASVAYCRHHRTSGKLPRFAPFLNRNGARAAAVELFQIGLWLDQGQEIEVFNYAKKNQTKAEIEAAIQATRARKEKWKNAKGTRSENVPETIGTRSENVPALSLSPSLSLLCLEGGAGGTEPEEQPAPEPATPQQKYQAAYERGIASGTRRGYGLPDDQREYLHQALPAHGRVPGGKALRGEALLKWIEASAKSFALWLGDSPAEAKFYSAYGPKGWLRWLNEGHGSETPSGVVVASLPPPPDAVSREGPKITAEDAKRIQREVLGETMTARVKTI